jgi:hypothetical protein
VFLARPAPALFARTIEEQIPLPRLDCAAGTVERAKDGEDLRKAAAAAERAGRGGGEQAQEAVAVREGHLGRGLVRAAREDDERAVRRPRARQVLRVR